MDFFLSFYTKKTNNFFAILYTASILLNDNKDFSEIN